MNSSHIYNVIVFARSVIVVQSTFYTGIDTWNSVITHLDMDYFKSNFFHVFRGFARKSKYSSGVLF